MKNQHKLVKVVTSLVLMGAFLLCSEASATYSYGKNFPLVRSKVFDSCAPNAKGKLRITKRGNVEVMEVKIEGLPKNTEFDAFVIQVPNFPFGLSWYQGDIHTNRYGIGYARFIGRFNEETFIVAPGKPTVAPHTHDTDATTNPVTKPVHTYHIGIWFNSPADALKAGCPDTVTPFNGEHTAGIQILNTGNYKDEKGPLLFVKP